MYLGVDVGGTKTLVALFDEKGALKKSEKFPTPPNYDAFLEQLAKNVAKLSTKDFKMACVAIPGKLDRENGVVLGYGTLQWGPQEVQKDIETIAGCPVLIENDAKLAGLSEAQHIINEFKHVLYVTLGTGISCALIIDGVIDPGMADSEGGQIWIESEGQRKQWEDVSSGKAIVARFGKKASDIDDPDTWKLIAHDLGLGLIDLIAVIQPQVIVMGGGVNTNFKKYISYLEKELKEYETPLVPIPPIRQAKRPEEAVIYGCYELIKDHRAPVKK